MASRKHQKARAGILLLFKGEARFLVFSVLVLESLIGVSAIGRSSRIEQTVITMGSFASLGAILLIVGFTRLFSNRRLYAEKLKQNERFAVGLGEEIYAAFDGSLRHLEDAQRKKAYEIFSDSFRTSPHARSIAEKRFLTL